MVRIEPVDPYNSKVDKAGDTMTGNLAINNPVNISKLSLSSGIITQASGLPLTFNNPIRILDTSQFTTNPISGAIEFVGGRFYITSANRRVISRASNVMTSSIVISNTSSTQCLFSGQITANTLLVGKMHKIEAFGSISTKSAADTVTINATMNGTTILTITSTAGVVTDSPWYAEIRATVRNTGSNGYVAAYGNIQLADKRLEANLYSAHIDTINVNAFGLNAKWDVADVDNTLRIDQGILHVFN